MLDFWKVKSMFLVHQTPLKHDQDKKEVKERVICSLYCDWPL